MFEGKHIHFSPLDNKPLCSYSSKLCRQRRLNGYAFCIRHILEDKSAPFKQCSYVTRNNYQKCLNAIPSNQERGYCHSHMQVAGIIPKTERKSKSGTTGSSTGGGTGSGINNNNNNISSSHVNGSSTTPPLGLNKGSPVPGGCTNDGKKHEEIPASVVTKIAGGPPTTSVTTTTNGHNNSNNNSNLKNAPGKAKSSVSSATPSSLVSAGKTKNRVICSKNTKVNGSLTDGFSEGNHGTLPTPQPPLCNGSNATKEKPRSKSAKQQQANVTAETAGLQNGVNKVKRKSQSCKKNPNAAEVVTPTGKTSEISGGVCINQNGEEASENQVTTLCVRDRWKNFRFLADLQDEKVAMKLERMKTMRALEKLPLFAETALPALKKDVKNSSTMYEDAIKKENSSPGISIPSGYDAVFIPPFLTKTRLLSWKNDKCEQKKDWTVEDKKAAEKEASKDFISDCRQWEWETRKEFLARVRQAFKRQYKTMKKACKLNDKMDRDEKAFRSALLACAMTDSSTCAKILTSENSSGSKVIGERKLAETEKQSRSGGGFCNADKSARSSASRPVNGQLTHPLKLGNMHKDSIHQKNQFQGQQQRMNELKNEGKSSFQDNIVRSTNPLEKAKINGSNHSHTSWHNGVNGKPEPKKAKVAKKPPKNPRSSAGVGASLHPKATVLVNPTKPEEPSSNDGSRKKVKKPPASARPTANKKRKVDENVMKSSNNLLMQDLQLKPCAEAVSSSLIIDPTPHDLLRDQMEASEKLLGHHQPGSVGLPTVCGLETVLNSVSSSDAATTPEGVITDASFDSPFDHSTSSHPDVEFSDDDLEKSFELQIDPEIAHQASRLLEDNGLTEDDFNELFPETRLGDSKIRGGDLSDLGIDFTSNFDTSDIDYSLFANIFPSFRSNQPESISVNQQF